MAAQRRNIAVLGGSGELGAPTIKTLLDRGIHHITAIQRREATSSFRAEVTVRQGNLEDEAVLQAALSGHDALVLMPPLTHIELQKPAIRAAARARVPYIFPSEFGPDPFADQLIAENQLLWSKKEMHDFVEAQPGVSRWISVAVGP